LLKAVISPDSYFQATSDIPLWAVFGVLMRLVAEPRRPWRQRKLVGHATAAWYGKFREKETERNGFISSRPDQHPPL
jgi:hypothetical protein